MPRPSPVRPLRWTIPARPMGAHMSIAGGIERSAERAAAVGATALQIFTKSSNQWAARPFTEGEPGRFRAAVAAAGITHVVAHDSYLINLCSPDDHLWEKSIAACAEELERCEALGIPWLVAHPGGHMGRGEEHGVRRMAEAIDRVYERARAPGAAIALETTAGQGTVIGYRFEHLAAILDRVGDPGRLGVCLDTCHLFAAGYDLRTREGYARTFRLFEDLIGFDRLVAIHVNDAKKPLGSRLDRHEHIGRGHLGLDAFRHLMNDPRLESVPLILETPKDEDCREDVENLTTLIGLVAGAGREAAATRGSAGARGASRSAASRTPGRRVRA